MFKTIIQATRATLLLALLTGIIFPLLITALGQTLFPGQANGSLIKSPTGTVIGSRLLAQQFVKSEYFHPRPSAAGAGYAGEASSGTNLGPTSSKLFTGQLDDLKTKEVDESFSGVKQLAQIYRKENNLPENYQVPVDAVTRSGSGLDPDISITNAKLQATRVAMARHLPQQTVLNAVSKKASQRYLGLFGEPRVNVLLLNIALDQKSE